MRTRALLGVVAAFGCGGSDAYPPGLPISLDSAGISITQWPTPEQWPSARPLRERIRIGSVDGSPEELFSSIAAGVILSDSAVVLADAGSQELRTFALDGTFLGGQGGEGGGPGEFEYIIGSGRCAPEGFSVFDLGWGISHYDAQGDFLRKHATRLEDGSLPYTMACSRSGQFAVLDRSSSSQGAPQGFHVAEASLRLLDENGRETASLGTRIGSERFGLPSGSGPHPIGRSTHLGFQSDYLLVSDGTFFGFERWTPEGSLIDIVRVDVGPPDADSAMATYLASAMARAEDDQQRTRWRAQIEAMGRPAAASYVSGLFVSGGAVFLRELDVDGAGRWFEYVPSRSGFEALTLPAGAKVLDVAHGLVLVEERDALGVSQGVIYGR